MAAKTPTLPPRQRAAPRQALYLDQTGGANAADAAGADINTLVAQYKRSGTMPVVMQQNPLYGDFTFPEDIHSMREAVQLAEDRFDDLPADVRTAAGNDWVQFLEMFNQDESRKTLENAGLIISKPSPPVSSNPDSPETPPNDPSPPAPTDPTPTPTT